MGWFRALTAAVVYIREERDDRRLGGQRKCCGYICMAVDTECVLRQMMEVRGPMRQV